ncbi:ARRDC3 [Branchiostoma lanceolatum]|uniref:ARRDC3 protein n=1 Tax=Branchiostoma lanceolatum TaxID=7740 RepID=A0A8J9ZRI0_BRALA|nr:ARRDC3 [Branchiostoma lanceolatum]
MGKLRQFAIELDEGKDVFHGGECVKGHVVVELAKEIAHERMCLRLQFRGHSHVQFDDDDEWRCEASETYFDHEVTIFGNERGQSGDCAVTSRVLPVGRHVFPFQYQLPADLPGSFEYRYEGYIRYVIKGTFDMESGKERTKRVFTILDKGDEDSWEWFSRTQPPSMAHSSAPEDVCCVGAVEVQAQPDRSVYCPGEAIVISGDVANNRNDYVIVEARLVQIARFHGSRNGRNEMKEAEGKVVQRAWISRCKGGESRSFSPSDGAVLRVPPLLPILSSRRFCNIIDLEYRLQVMVQRCNLKIQFPIKICSCWRDPHDGTQSPLETPPSAPPADFTGPAVVNQPASYVPSVPDIDAPPSDLEACGEPPPRKTKDGYYE